MKLQNNQRQKLISELTERFIQDANPKTKKWFDNYLKGAIEYRGLKTPQVTALVKDWYKTNRLNECSLSEQLDLCHHLIASRFAEDKFAGTIYIQKFLLNELDFQDILAESNFLFQKGYFFDWSTTDWFTNRVLDPIIIKSGTDAAEIVANWRYSNNFWQRRAAIVAFKSASCDHQYHSLIFKIIDLLVKEDQRFIQTGIGWVLADMSKVFPTEVESLFRQHLDLLAQEVVDRHAKYLDCHQELKLLKRKQTKSVIIS